MKILHTGDVHIGSPMRNFTPEKARLREAELIETFRRMAVFANTERVGAVLIAGDLFDGMVNQTLKREIFNVIAAAAPVAFFYVSGNHDGKVGFDGAPNNFYRLSQNHDWGYCDLPENITVAGLDGEDVEEKIELLQLRKDRFNLVLLHGETSVEKGQGDCIPLQKLRGKHIDYLALGHIHKPMYEAEKLDSRGKYRYCGCLEGRGFDEIGQRGCFLLEIVDQKLVKEQFLPFAKREAVCARVDISACGSYFDVERAVANVLQTEKGENMVKVVLCGRHQAGLKKDLALLTERLNEHFFTVRIEDESSIFIDYSAYQNDLTERGEFVREVGRYEMNEDLRAEILDVGLKALAGEEIDL